MFKKIQYVTLAFIFAMFINDKSYAQLKQAYERTADQATKDQDFYTAAFYYKKALSAQKEKNGAFNPYNGEVLEKGTATGTTSSHKKMVFKLAESYRQYYNWDDAAPWYEQAATFTEPEFQTAKYWNAICLRTKGDYIRAASMLEEFLKTHTTKDVWTKWATNELDNCKFAIEMQKNKTLVKYKISKLPNAVNDQSANYAPVLLSDDVLAFTSTRNRWNTNRNNFIEKNSTVNPKDHVNDLFQINLTKMNDAKEVNVPITAMDQGTSTFSSDKRRMYLTRWKIENGKKISSIFLSTKQENDKWSTPVVLNSYVNVNGYNSKQPFISSDGQYIFFSSDRPNGMGKFDLWVCNLGSDGYPSEQAVNLIKINTPEEEEAPFYHTNTKQLFFSSNGRKGFGGFDFYVAKGVPKGTFNEPVNLGEPFNSSKDDVYFTSGSLSDPMSQAYISSDRSSACCLEIFNVNRKQQSWVMSGKVLNCKDKKMVSDVTGMIKDQQTQTDINTVQTDMGGRYTQPYKEGQKITITFSKEGFFTQTREFEPVVDRTTETIMLPDVCLQPIEIAKAIVLENIFYDFDKATLREISKLELDKLVTILKENPTLQVQLNAHTDSKGKHAYNMRLSDARAKSCVEYLILKGIDRSRLTSKGFGATKPIAPNKYPDGSDNPEGRQQNRRTEFQVIGIKQHTQVKS